MPDQVADSPAKAQIVRIKLDQGKTGLLYATSPDLKGLLVAERSMQDLEREIPIAIAGLFQAAGEDVVIIQAEDLAGENPVKSWVKVPASVNRQIEIA
jgi:hypothetical protein